MTYDESVFKEKANRKARKIWIIFAVLLSANYGSDVANGLQQVPYYIAFLVLCWVPILSGEVLLRVKGFATESYKYNLAIGYGIFYAFLVSTTSSPIAFTYVLPVTSLLVLYKNRQFMVGCGIANTIINIGAIVYRVSLGFNSDTDMKNYQLQISCIVLCYICYVMSIKHLNESDGAMTESIKSDLNRVVTTVEQVKHASNSIIDGMAVVSELASENTHGANVVAKSMKTLHENNETLQDTTASSNEMTSDIQSQVNHVADMIEQMVALTAESGEHARTSSDDLDSLVTTANQMADLSGGIEHTLRLFKDEFEMVKEQTGTIENITSQTNLLALNASIEAARAGEAGRGFSVVANQIRELSNETQSSSGQIRDALQRLETTAESMTASMEQTLELIQQTLEKVTKAGESVTKIAADASQLDENIQTIDTAMKEVENSNIHLVENLEHVSGIVEGMTACIADSNEISSRMLSKYDESANNINSIENVVEALMCELGIGGFMGVEDVLPGMRVMLDTDQEKKYYGEVVSKTDNTLTASFHGTENLAVGTPCMLQITVGNVLYCWKQTKIQKKNEGQCVISLESRPKINNRRKYPRVDLANDCTITVDGLGRKISGTMDNLSANGFAFMTKDDYFVDRKGEELSIEIDRFGLPDHNKLTGRVIRCSNNDGVYIIGCQLPADDIRIRDYVEKKLAN